MLICARHGQRMADKMEHTTAQHEIFERAYIAAALWSSDMDHKDTDDLTRAARKRIKEDCRQFLQNNAELLSLASMTYDGGIYSIEQAGHDFWLTRNGHGAGFWDRGLRKDIGEKLTIAAESMGECHLYIQRGRVGIE